MILPREAVIEMSDFDTLISDSLSLFAIWYNVWASLVFDFKKIVTRSGALNNSSLTIIDLGGGNKFLMNDITFLAQIK